MDKEEEQVMSGGVKGIIAAGAVLLLLGGGLLALKLTEKPEETDNEPIVTVAEDTSVERFKHDVSEVKNVSISNKNDEAWELIQKDETTWAVKGFDDDIKYSSPYLNALVKAAASMSTKETIEENPSDLSVYGLDEPSSTTKITFADNSTVGFKIGNETPSNDAYYILFDGDSTVYTVADSSSAPFMYARYNLLDKTLIPTADEEGTALKVKKLTVDRADKDYDIVVEYDSRIDDESAVTANNSSYIMTSPVNLAIHPDNGTGTVESLFGLTAKEALYVKPKSELFEVVGLNEPTATMTVLASDNKTYTVTIGKEMKSGDEALGYSVYVEGIDVVWLIPKEDMPLLTCEPLDLTATLIGGVYIYNLTALNITTPDASDKFTMTGSSPEDFAIKLNGSDADFELFKKLYQFILRAPAEDLYMGDKDNLGKPDLTLEFKTSTGEDQTLEFYRWENRKTIISFNGEPLFLTRTAYLDRLLGNIENYKNGESMIETW